MKAELLGFTGARLLSYIRVTIHKDINAIGFDPTIGFLHELAHSKTPLVNGL
jgi:hypothetical protein